MPHSLSGRLARARGRLAQLLSSPLTRSRRFRQALAVAAAVCSPPALALTPYVWEQVTLPLASGAACGNGTPYKFFVNTNPLSTKWVVVFEGGGACWSQSACLQENGLLGASLPNGIPDNYMSSLDGVLAGGTSFLGLSTPFITRVPVLGTTTKTQDWNMVYMPYCTGDVHAGNKVSVYADKYPDQPRVEYHRGYVNAKVAEAWMAANLPRPSQLLVTGFSAGGVGAVVNYDGVRAALKPTGLSSMLNDSGMLFLAPQGGSPATYPSVPLHTRIRKAWNIDGPGGVLTDLMAKYPSYAYLANDLGGAAMAIGKIFPKDRFGTATFQQDMVYSKFSYNDFYPDVAAATGDAQKALLNKLWRQDLANLTNAYKSAPANMGYYIPYGRNMIGSHTLSMLTFDSTGIYDWWNYKDSLNDFVDDLTNESPYRWNALTWKWDYIPVQRSWQQTQQMANSSLLVSLVGLLNPLLGF